MSSAPCRLPGTKQGWQGGGQGGKPPIPPPSTPEGNALGCRRGAVGTVGFGGAAPLGGVQVRVLLTPAMPPAVFHVTRLLGLVSPCLTTPASEPGFEKPKDPAKRRQSHVCICSPGAQGGEVREPCVRVPSWESPQVCPSPGAPGCQQGLAQRRLHAAQAAAQGPLLPRLRRATWQQVQLPETCLSQWLRSPRGGGSQHPLCWGPSLAVPLVLGSGGGRTELFPPATIQQQRAEGGCCLSLPAQRCILGGRGWQGRQGAGMDSPTLSR